MTVVMRMKVIKYLVIRSLKCQKSTHNKKGKWKVGYA